MWKTSLKKSVLSKNYCFYDWKSNFLEKVHKIVGTNVNTRKKTVRILVKRLRIYRHYAGKSEEMQSLRNFDR